MRPWVPCAWAIAQKRLPRKALNRALNTKMRRGYAALGALRVAIASSRPSWPKAQNASSAVPAAAQPLGSQCMTPLYAQTFHLRQHLLTA